MFRRRQCTAVLVCASLALISPGAPGRTEDYARVATADIWQEVLLHYLEMLERFLRYDGPIHPETAARMSALSDWYRAMGIPSEAEESDGLAIVRDTHAHLRTDPGYLAPETRSRFLADLEVIYAELGGDPGELGPLAP